MYHLCKHMPVMQPVYSRVPRITHYHFCHSAYFPWGHPRAMCLSIYDRPGFYFGCIKIRNTLLGFVYVITVPNSKREMALDIHPLQTSGEFIFQGQIP